VILNFQQASYATFEYYQVVALKEEQDNHIPAPLYLIQALAF
jgi:hypothetical protein